MTDLIQQPLTSCLTRATTDAEIAMSLRNAVVLNVSVAV